MKKDDQFIIVWNIFSKVHDHNRATVHDETKTRDPRKQQGEQYTERFSGTIFLYQVVRKPDKEMYISSSVDVVK